MSVGAHRKNINRLQTAKHTKMRPLMNGMKPLGSDVDSDANIAMQPQPQPHMNEYECTRLWYKQKQKQKHKRQTELTQTSWLRTSERESALSDVTTSTPYAVVLAWPP